MKLPAYTLAIIVPWLAASVAFWWFATAFNGLPFFSLPTLASPSEGADWQLGLAVQLVIFGVMLAPFIALPFAIAQCLRSRNLRESKNNAPDQ